LLYSEKLEKLQLLRDSYDTQRKHNKNVIALLETSEREFQVYDIDISFILIKRNLIFFL
jgi:hypothetical protein